MRKLCGEIPKSFDNRCACACIYSMRNCTAAWKNTLFGNKKYNAPLRRVLKLSGSDRKEEKKNLSKWQKKKREMKSIILYVHVQSTWQWVNAIVVSVCMLWRSTRRKMREETKNNLHNMYIGVMKRAKRIRAEDEKKILIFSCLVFCIFQRMNAHFSCFNHVPLHCYCTISFFFVLIYLWMLFRRKK